ncbi:hypothetical protein [Tenacibaculum finnmarkense]|uniref:Uncharacterized protein n=1 Tax=Tenacibaculum finnmarkense genomovar finnmarkense TaxID=1458503 RepID=A0AAP1WHA6_9FLAO|nr:hypothetical protein [Tenacibaculum finnmarkense]SOS48989.1 conserved hypothetical protein [Tenacibaculum dicentrarchi]MBE7653948.1 hypothetical protein [Tenacibaculum finnmarkense genomovar finnmarkense]MBE7696249.1 hypothetical protein [Tenacibaculum finnmarkense genomovar finnmarkense]MCD8428499.1 hypothetical protein [Tenacibaculum finnmarkense genomovar finnmarkense]MCG8732267.1 hypothetical protein [Tenacibaculum finnmarkense]
MTTILENLKLYFQNNSKEQIKKDWSESEKYNGIGPKIDDFIEQTIYHHKIKNNKDFWEITSLNNITKNPKFTSDFLFKLA